ncbi:hypothetical protein [Gallaecimonas sp. GXIMD4217]|uniref:hypothetical protein n=1 Tax=Gallaecimonas sp. GXIMD4217 TaxID=3131927 RepID=UPI00311AE1F0
MLHFLHRCSAALLASYVLVHLLNHLLALTGIEAHLAFMDGYRAIYRFQAIEPLLLGLVGFQAGSGLYFIYKRRGQRRGFFERAQALSGAYLAFFLLVHVTAVLYGRLGLGLDTNFYYAAAGLNIQPYTAFFLPYYFLAVLALFTHIGCALHWLLRKRLSLVSRHALGYGALALGVLVATVILSTFMGAFYPVDIPEEFRETFQ